MMRLPPPKENPAISVEIIRNKDTNAIEKIKVSVDVNFNLQNENHEVLQENLLNINGEFFVSMSGSEPQFDQLSIEFKLPE